LTINSTEPIFYYCGAPNSCIQEQMVGVINPNSTQTLAKFKQAAGDAPFMVLPGEPIPAEGSSSLSATSSTAPTSSPTSSPAPSHGVHIGGGAIAGIVVGAVAFLILAAALFFFIGRTKSLKEMMHRKDATVSRPMSETTHWNGSQHPGSPGFPPSPFSPAHSQMGFDQGGQLPPYGQHNATDAHPSGWLSPTGQQQPMAETKYSDNPPVHEMSSSQAYTAELEAPQRNKSK
jgi:hypothetical protein